MNWFQNVPFKCNLRRYIEALLRSFEPFQERYEQVVKKEAILYRKEFQLRNMLIKSIDDEGSSMDKWYATLKLEKVGTIESVKKLCVADFRLIGIPLGDAMVIIESAKKADTLLDRATMQLIPSLIKDEEPPLPVGQDWNEGCESGAGGGKERREKKKTAEEKARCSFY